MAGSTHVVVLHADGIRTSYSFLAAATVRRGDRVTGGQQVGVAGDRLHFGARVGEDYIDPSLLLSEGSGHIHLVPDGDVRPETEGRERSSVEGMVRDLGAGLGRVSRAAVGWARSGAVAAGRLAADGGAQALGQPIRQLADRLERLRGVAHYLRTLGYELNAVALAVELGGAALGWDRSREGCTPPEAAPPPVGERHILIEVAGLGSHTGTGADAAKAGAIARLDTAALGYASADVLQFSYRGGTTAERAYSAADTQVDIRESGRRLRELLERLRAEHPGVTVDIVAHSQGGLVVRAALGSDYATFDSRLPPLGAVVTIGTPHRGANLATAGDIVGYTGLGTIIRGVGGVIKPGGIDPGSESVRQLSALSSFLHDLNGRPLPSGLRVTSIAARGDMVVPPGSARLPGAVNEVVSVGGPLSLSDHDALPSSPAATRAVALALAGAAPTCESLVDALTDALAAHLVSTAEDALGAGLASHLF